LSKGGVTGVTETHIQLARYR